MFKFSKIKNLIRCRVDRIQYFYLLWKAFHYRLFYHYCPVVKKKCYQYSNTNWVKVKIEKQHQIFSLEFSSTYRYISKVTIMYRIQYHDGYFNTNMYS